jgi:hypothetical protein
MAAEPENCCKIADLLSNPRNLLTVFGDWA